MNLYIDIDGVLLTKTQTIPSAAFEFIDFVTTHFECYWLTTHCKGECAAPLKYVATVYPMEYIQKLAKLKPTNWDTLKTEAIDFTQFFYWIDDYAFQAEKRILEHYQVSSSLLEVNLALPNALKNVMITLNNGMALK